MFYQTGAAAEFAWLRQSVCVISDDVIRAFGNVTVKVKATVTKVERVLSAKWIKLLQEFVKTSIIRISTNFAPHVAHLKHVLP